MVPATRFIQTFYDTFGPSKLMWGSEFTHIELPSELNLRANDASMLAGTM